jgi:hypothetical protein
MLLAVALAVAPSVQAAGSSTGNGVNPNQVFLGGGFSSNSVSGSDDGTGFQIFGGYHFGKAANNIKLDLEIGYMDTGSMDVTVNVPFIGRVTTDARAKGLWATPVARIELNPQFDLIVRAGLDFGDDDGLMVGVGLGYNINKQSQFRIEYVERDNVNSLQFNVMVSLK